MKRSKAQTLLERSCRWIRHHWNATNLDVPNDLLSEWIFEAAEDEDARPSGFYLAVFSFGFLQHYLIAHNVPQGVMRSFPADELLDGFQKWQMKLALAEIHRVTDVRVKPLALFSFPEDERIEFCRDLNFPAPKD